MGKKKKPPTSKLGEKKREFLGDGVFKGKGGLHGGQKLGGGNSNRHLEGGGKRKILQRVLWKKKNIHQSREKKSENTTF